MIVRWGGTSDPNGGGTFNETLYDPIALHKAAVAARTAITPAVTPPAGTQPGAVSPNLTDAEKKLLTPSSSRSTSRSSPATAATRRRARTSAPRIRSSATWSWHGRRTRPCRTR
ncbi:MAG: hypothetical protein M0D55_06425 [Elusimicrobiota bacterium]|nr:MAG: hypothetical protein M0D55_06425 [Elusimicrobiota bacterium]